MPHTQSYLSDADVTAQHAPWTGDGGARDSRYGLSCLDLWSAVTANLTMTSYDVISFNFGIHDVNYAKYVEEFVPIDEYEENLRDIKSKLLATGASVVYQTTTPISYNGSDPMYNDMVLAYNDIARSVMAEEETAVVPVNDLYQVIIDVCGDPPYNDGIHANCSISNYNDVHYKGSGYDLLGNSTANSILSLLEAASTQTRPWPTPRDDDDPTISCPTNRTNSSAQYTSRCPADATCMVNEWAYNGAGCCLGLGTDAVDCGDSDHCCPSGWGCNITCSHCKDHCTECWVGQCIPPSVGGGESEMLFF